MRIGGLASGLDTDTMVKQMMMPYQMKADRIKQDKILTEYKQSIYREVMGDMKSLYTKYFDIGSNANKDTNLIMGSNYDTVKFSSSDESVITARGLAGAKTGNYDVSVEQMASSSSLTIDKDSIKGDELVLNIGGQELNIAIDAKDDSSAIVSKINKSIEQHNETDGVTKIDVKITSSELGGNIRIESKLTGEKNNIAMTATVKKTGEVGNIIATGKDSTDAIVNITDAYGNTARKEFETNKFVIDNVEYSVNGVSKKVGTEFENTKLTGIADASKIVENVSAFVEDYNKLIDKMNGLLGEKQDKSFRPLTDEQKKDMSENEIKLWEEKSKKGLLRSDDILYSTVNELLGNISSSAGLDLGAMGISPNPDYRTQKGKITLDTEKLTAALENNGEETRKALTSTFTKMKDTLYETAISADSKIAKRAGAIGGVTAFNNELTKKIEEEQKEYQKIVRSLSKREDRYYSEFARLEVAMNKANAQMSQFMSMG